MHYLFKIIRKSGKLNCDKHNYIKAVTELKRTDNLMGNTRSYNDDIKTDKNDNNKEIRFHV